MKIGVMGTGGVGGYFGGLLVRAGLDTHFVARGKHLRTIQDEGLQVISDQGNFRVRIHATAEPDEIGPVDLLLFCVKSYDTLDAARLVAPMVEEETMILTLQNGIDNIEKLIQIYGEDRVLGGTSFIEASLASPGMIVHTGKPGRIAFGELSGQRTERVEAVLRVFQQAGIDAELSPDISQVLWSKFLFICGAHGVCTVSRSPLGMALAFHETRELLEGVMHEVETLARARGVAMPETVVEDAILLAESYNKKFKPSMLRDLEWRRSMEIEALNGMVVKLGKEIGVETPLNQAIYACLKLENHKILNPLWATQLEDFT
ncbi:ketopantoate reductase family protein [Desulforhabdus amnigena]|uniref:2-dehydropantoate 2-reductase n=1 Tax=Desulforhabdus amnigena TaxID=40218 RepID=A0A9W6D4W5_9BACT|nr:2-dehydropantoate 2-reductase [Desulforhabdus amnigena]NLJ27379.1 2-dehydropantoate 2-reductase [Deltaproteobacteria bacterium]GLI34227.1 2-dehydropantoate 2-reductase [Desulforhabdus amnigena]